MKPVLKQTVILIAVFAVLAVAIDFLVPAMVASNAQPSGEGTLLPWASIGFALMGLGLMQMIRRKPATQPA